MTSANYTLHQHVHMFVCLFEDIPLLIGLKEMSVLCFLFWIV